ncbi:MAG TPA: hypothetical protein VGK54_05210 [Chloroflexota bacterium]
MIRSMRPIDALAVRPLTGRDGDCELTAPTWPKAPPESHHLSLLELVSSSLVPPGRTRRLALSSANAQVHGLIMARARAAGLVWDVEHLLCDASPDTSVELLRWLSMEAINVGSRRIFLETPTDGVGASVAARAGFERCTGGALYRLDPGFQTIWEDTFPARPRLRSDEMSIFHLYNAAVPAGVRAFEALTYEEWTALHRGRKPWSPSFWSQGQDYVWEIGSRVSAWMHMVFGDRAQHITMLIHPESEGFADRMVREALGQLSPKAPVLADVREYQTALEGTLQRFGFQKQLDYVVWVRQLAERVAEPAVVSGASPVVPSL